MSVTLPLTLAAVVAGVAGTGAAAGVVRRRARVDGWAVLAGLLAAGAVGAAALVWTGTLPSGQIRWGFTAMHLLYLGLTVSLPLLGLGLVVLRLRAGGGRLALVGAVLLLVPAPVGAYATHVEPTWLRVDEVPVPLDGGRAGDDPVRVAVLADYQTLEVGDHERAAVDAVLASEPDLVLVAGDLFQGPPARLAAELPALREDLGRLRAPHGVYVVRGDADLGDSADRIFDGSGAVILDDEVVDVAVGDRTVRIGGTTLAGGLPGDEGGDRVRAELAATPDDEAVTVLLSHRPDTVLGLAPGAVDLVVAGHTHGGQVVVPGFGPPLTLTDVPRHVARGGLHEVDGNAVYVSPGVGVERGRAPQVRLFNRPAVGILTLADAPS